MNSEQPEIKIFTVFEIRKFECDVQQFYEQQPQLDSASFAKNFHKQMYVSSMFNVGTLHPMHGHTLCAQNRCWEL